MIRAARPFILIVGLFGLWWLAAILVEALTGKGRFLLPTPDLVWAAFVENPAYFLKGFRVTLIEVALGLLIGAALGLWLTLVLAVSKHVRFWLLPLLVISQAIPVFALIWGARDTDLTELLTRINEGVSIGATVISPGNLLTFVERGPETPLERAVVVLNGTTTTNCGLPSTGCASWSGRLSAGWRGSTRKTSSTR